MKNLKLEQRIKDESFEIWFEIGYATYIVVAVLMQSCCSLDEVAAVEGDCFHVGSPGRARDTTNPLKEG